MRLQNITDRIRYKISSTIIKKYRKNVPLQQSTTFVDHNNEQWLDVVVAGPESFIPNVTGKNVIEAVCKIQKKLTPDKWIEFVDKFYEKGLTSLNNNWYYADILTVLFGITETIKVENYLEIGVRRGRSMSVVASQVKDAYIVGFDMWIDNYAGLENANPGPDFVRDEMNKVGFKGELDLIDGNSRITVPEYFQNNPDKYFDLITVDGDHSSRGAKIDIKNVIKRLKIGGLIVIDDIDNPNHRSLKKIWYKTFTKQLYFFL